MSDKQKKLLRFIFIILCIISSVSSFLFFQGPASQFLFIIPSFLIIAIIVVTNLEKSGFRALLVAFYPILSGAFSHLKDTGPAIKLSGIYNDAISLVLNKQNSNLSYTLKGDDALVVTFFLCVLLILFVDYIVSTYPVLGKHSGKTKPEFRDKSYNERLNNFCKHLMKRIETINSATHWSDDMFTPLDAEVEINIKGKRHKKYRDLLKCLKKTRRKKDVFLVVGDPGSGKSVSLRKLTAELLIEAKRSKIVPVYVNLKEWKHNWTVNDLPTENDLCEFIKASLRAEGSFVSDQFLDDYFDNMLADGRWYFIIDSFDELPCLMGRNDCSEVIDYISSLLYRFLTGPEQNGGIVASRLFHRPSDQISASHVLRILDFNNIKIRDMLMRYFPKHSNTKHKELIRELFQSREDLTRIARNPFCLSLIAEYIKHEKALPQNQMQLYDSFIRNRLRQCAGKLEEESLAEKDVTEAAIRIAEFMQTSRTPGLEVSINDLAKNSNDRNYWDKIADVLRYSKLCRVNLERGSLSFAHRRFQEYYIVKKYISSGDQFTEKDYQCILANTGLRDALVLYCEIAEDQKAQEIANYCIDEILRDYNQSNNLNTEPCQHFLCAFCFLGEAFQTRPEILASRIEEVKAAVDYCIENRSHFLVLYSIANNLAIFDEDYIEKTILALFSLDSSLLTSSIMEQCRLLKHTSSNSIQRQLNIQIAVQPLLQNIKNFRNLHFSFQLSETLRKTMIFQTSFILSRIVQLFIFTTFFMYFSANNYASSVQSNNTAPNVPDFIALMVPVYIFYIFLIYSFGITPIYNIKKRRSQISELYSNTQNREKIYPRRTSRIKILIRSGIYCLLSTTILSSLEALLICYCRGTLQVSSIWVFLYVFFFGILFAFHFVCFVITIILEHNLISTIPPKTTKINLKRIIKICVLLFLTVFIMLLFLQILFWVVDKSFLKTFVTISYIVCGIAVGTGSFPILKSLICDKIKLKRVETKKEMCYEVVFEYLSSLDYERSKIQYLDMLIENKVHLYGDYPSGTTISWEVAQHLAKLESQSSNLPVKL